MEKTFREVIADIKEGEVWESKNKIVRCFFDGIQIYHKDESRHTPSMLMLDIDKFTLRRKLYTFEEAFKALEEGKKIESCFTGIEYKLEGEEVIITDDEIALELYANGFDYKEIKGNWYIN